MGGKSIVFLVSHPSAGGAQEIMANLADGFADRGGDVRLMALYPTDRAARDTRLPWQYIVSERPRSLRAMLAMARAIVRWFRDVRPDVVFTALPAANLMAALGAWTARSGSRVVISHHSPVETHNRLIDFADGYAGSLGSVHAVVSVSDTVSASLDGKPAAYRAKRRTIHNALPPPIEALLGRLEAQRSPRTALARKVVATGRLAAQKNYPTLLRAAARMPDVMVDIIGDGPDREPLAAMARRLDLGGRVNFLGHRPREETLALLADADIFAQVSLFEGHSLALVEAAKLGLPLVVSDVPVQIEGVTARDGERCAVVVPAHDDVALAQECRRLLDDPAHYAAAAARSRRLGVEATYETMMQAYQKLAA